jgi:hypothetical protein
MDVHIAEQLMDWDRFKANEVIGDCRVALRDLGPLLGKPCILEVVQPTKGKLNVIGKDNCSATLSISLSLSERKDFKLEEVPPLPAHVQLSFSSTEGVAAESAQRTQTAASLTEDKPFSEGVESGNGIESTWSRLEQLNHKLGSSPDRNHARWSVSSPRNVFDSILCSLDSPRGEQCRVIVFAVGIQVRYMSRVRASLTTASVQERTTAPSPLLVQERECFQTRHQISDQSS